MFRQLLIKSLLFLSMLGSYSLARVLKIDGGQDVNPPGKWPFMVSQQVILADGYQHSCGASLISDNWLLSAAHCLYTLTPSTIIVILGAHDILTQEEGNPTHYEVEDIFVHPGWTGDAATGFQNDIALMRLATPANIASDFIDIVPMATESDGDFAGQLCYIIGWGLFDFDDGTGDFPNILQETTMTVLSQPQCVEVWGEEMIEPSQVCVVDNNSTPCSSDSGGPLVCQVSGVWTLVGATSWGACPSVEPAVYARVSSFRDWIFEISGL